MYSPCQKTADTERAIAEMADRVDRAAIVSIAKDRLAIWRREQSMLLRQNEGSRWLAAGQLTADSSGDRRVIAQRERSIARKLDRIEREHGRETRDLVDLATSLFMAQEATREHLSDQTQGKQLASLGLSADAPKTS